MMRGFQLQNENCTNMPNSREGLIFAVAFYHRFISLSFYALGVLEEKLEGNNQGENYATVLSSTSNFTSHRLCTALVSTTYFPLICLPLPLPPFHSVILLIVPPIVDDRYRARLAPGFTVEENFHKIANVNSISRIIPFFVVVAWLLLLCFAIHSRAALFVLSVAVRFHISVCDWPFGCCSVLHCFVVCVPCMYLVVGSNSLHSFVCLFLCTLSVRSQLSYANKLSTDQKTFRFQFTIIIIRFT